MKAGMLFAKQQVLKKEISNKIDPSIKNQESTEKIEKELKDNSIKERRDLTSLEMVTENLSIIAAIEEINLNSSTSARIK